MGWTTTRTVVSHERNARKTNQKSRGRQRERGEEAAKTIEGGGEPLLCSIHASFLPASLSLSSCFLMLLASGLPCALSCLPLSFVSSFLMIRLSLSLCAFSLLCLAAWARGLFVCAFAFSLISFFTRRPHYDVGLNSVELRSPRPSIRAIHTNTRKSTKRGAREAAAWGPQTMSTLQKWPSCADFAALFVSDENS